MKFLKPIKSSVSLKKRSSINAALAEASAKKAAKQRQNFVPKQRDESTGPVTKVKLNVSGNRRGLHMQDSPPDSEEMRRRRAMRRLWNKKMPSLHCSQCQFSSQCPQFRAGYECAFLPFLNSHSIDSEQDLLFYAKELCGENVKRAQLMLIMERLSGAKPDLDTSEALSHVFQQMMALHERLTDQGDTSIEVETTDGTIIGRLFGNLDRLVGSTKTAHETTLDVPAYAAESKLLDDEPIQTDAIATPRREVSAELVRELSMMSTKDSPGRSEPATPIQESL